MGTYLKFYSQTIAKRLRFARSTVGSPLNLKPVLIRSRDELNWPGWVRQPVIPRENIRSYEGVQMTDVWDCKERKLLV